MKSKKLALRIFSYVFMALFMIVIVCSMVLPGGSMNSYADEDANPTVSIEEEKTDASAGSRKVNITVTNPEKNVTYYVYYRTQNGSAIADENFESKDDYCTLTSEKPTTQIEIEIKDTGKILDTYGIGTLTYMDHTVSSTKTFIFEIYYAESTGSKIYDKTSTNTDGTVLIDSAASELTLSCHEPKVTLPTKSKKGTSGKTIPYYEQSLWVTDGNYFVWTSKCFDNYEDDSLTLQGETVYVGNMQFAQSGYSYSSNPVFGYCYVPSTYSDYFVDTLGAQKYIYITKSTVNGGDAGIFSPKFYTALYYINSYDKYGTGKVSVGNRIAYGNKVGYSTFTTSGNVFDSIMTDCENGTTRKQIDGTYGISIDNSYTYILWAWHKEYCESSYYGIATKNCKISYTYNDTKAPSVTGYYVQNSTYSAGQKIRLSLKFDEIVRINDYTKTLPQVVFNYQGTSSNGTLTFKYAGGDGTDTLYFEATVSSKSTIVIDDLQDYGSDIGLEYFNLITDFSYNESSGYYVMGNEIDDDDAAKMGLDNLTANSATALTINTKSPTMTVDSDNSYIYDASNQSTAYSTNAAKNYIYGATMTFTLTNVSEDEYVYYCWVKEGEDAPVSFFDYTEHTTVYDNNGVLQASITTLNSSGEALSSFSSGSYTLYVLYRSASFVSVTRSYDFVFDLDKPVVTYTAPDGYNLNRSSHTVTFTATDTSGIASVEYAVSTSPLETESTLENYFVTYTSGTARGNTYSGSITINSSTLNVADGEADTYYLYLKVTEKNGLYTFIRSDFSVALDLRSDTTIADQFVDAVYSTCDDPTTDEYYDSSLGMSILTKYIGDVYYQSAGFTWSSVGVTWTYTIRYVDQSVTSTSSTSGTTVTGTVDGLNNFNDSDTFYELSSYTSGGGMYYVLNLISDGYYTITVSYTPTGSDPLTYTKEIYVYGNEEGSGENYLNLSDDTRYLITKYWSLTTSQYKALNRETNTVETYYFITNSGSSLSSHPTPVFATYAEAYQYVYDLEVADVELVQMSGELYATRGTLRFGDDVTVEEDSWWYRYKPAEYSSLTADSYVYYYYGYKNNPNSNLSLAIKSNVEKIVGTESSNSYNYATYNSTVSADSGSSMYISSSKASLSSAMYSSTVTYNGVEMYLASSYTVTATNGTKLYYREYGSTGGLSQFTAGYSLTDVFTSGGAYEVYEIGKYGAVKYYIYVDAATPDLGITVTDGSGGNSYWSYPENTTTKLYGKSFTITGVSDFDEWSVIQVLRGDTTVLQQTFDEFTTCTFTDSGTYTVYVFDRSGNSYSVSITIKSTDIEVTSSSSTSQTYNFTISTRSSTELTALKVYYNGTPQTVDGNDNSLATYPTSFTFYLSGTYTIYAKDIYGYVYEQDITLQKSLPDVTIMISVNGSYVDITNYPDYYSYNADTNTYTILTPSAVYLRWTKNSSYVLSWLTEPDSDSYTTNVDSASGLTTYIYYSVAESTDGWSARIGYTRDTAASIYIISQIDNTAPFLTAESADGEVLGEDARVNTSYVTISWEENESAMTSVVYTYEGESYGISTSIDQTGSYTLGSAMSPLADGTYTVTATNILGVSSTITFTIHTTIDVYVSTSDGLANYDRDATVYENEDNLIMLTDEFLFTIDSTLYGNYSLVVAYEEDTGLNFLIYDPSVNYTSDDDVEYYNISADDLAGLVNGAIYTSGDGFTSIFRNNFGVYVGKTADGELYLAIAAINSSGEDIYSVAIEESGVEITLTFAICSDETEIPVRFSDGNDLLEFDSTGTYMYNKPVYIAKADQNLDDITYMYYTYEGSEPIVIYDGTTFTPATFSDEGAYVIYATNKYTTVTTRTIRLYESIILDAYTIYADGTKLETDSTTIYSNGSVQFVGISRTTYETDITDLVFALSNDGSSYILTITNVGSYSFTITDGNQNTRTYYVVIAAPASVTLTDKETAFSGWDADALRADELYTNTMVTFKSSYITDKNISYITYEYYADQTSDSTNLELTTSGILLDKLTGSEIDETSLQIGWLGDGLYVIRMYDYSGNLVTYNSASYLSINYKSASQLSLGRQTRASDDEEEYSLDLALSQGFYSNSELIFAITAKTYVLTVNGVNVAATDGIYTIQADASTTYAEYAISYCDEYGNKMEFTAYIITEIPQISFVDSDILVTISSTTYAVGSPALTATGTGVTAYYYKDGASTAIDYTAGEQISGDGEYLLYFVDIAGNISSVNFVIDTEVQFTLGSGTSTTSYTVIFDGAVSNYTVRVLRSTEQVSVISVTLDGKDISSNYSTTSSSYAFSDNGAYTIVLTDAVGNTKELSFTVVKDPVQEFTYTLPTGYVLVSLSYNDGGLTVYVNSGENLPDGGIYLNGDHTWTAVLTNALTAEEYSFTITTDNTSPDATFSGYAEVTKDSVTITSVNEDGTVKIYKDGSLESSATVYSGNSISLECSDYGSYRVVVTDLAGNVTEYEFTIQYSMSAMTIAFIVVIAALLVLLLVVVVVIRRRVKIR